MPYSKYDCASFILAEEISWFSAWLGIKKERKFMDMYWQEELKNQSSIRGLPVFGTSWVEDLRKRWNSDKIIFSSVGEDKHAK